MTLSPAARGVLARHRLGSVPYLNARPLVEGLPADLTLEVPSRLAQRFAAGELDAALVPVFEAVSRPRATIVDGVAIACRGEVYSVFLAHREPLGDVRSLALDPASRTSSHLLRVLLVEFLGLRPEFTAEPGSENQARLLIGDAAVSFRRAEEGRGEWRFLDLGAEWLRRTGLPFVFACWVLRDGLPEEAALAAALREARAAGLAARDQIAAATDDPAFTRSYLADFIRFDLGADERLAIARYATLLRKHGLIDADPALRFV